VFALPRSGDHQLTVQADFKPMIRYRIASKLGLVEPLVRMQRWADAAALASADHRRDEPQRSSAELRSA
jgi:hypothetical protein